MLSYAFALIFGSECGVAALVACWSSDAGRLTRSERCLARYFWCTGRSLRPKRSQAGPHQGGFYAKGIQMSFRNWGSAPPWESPVSQRELRRNLPAQQRSFLPNEGRTSPRAARSRPWRVEGSVVHTRGATLASCAESSRPSSQGKLSPQLKCLGWSAPNHRTANRFEDCSGVQIANEPNLVFGMPEALEVWKTISEL
jgi:hypothetical protein